MMVDKVKWDWTWVETKEYTSHPFDVVNRKEAEEKLAVKDKEIERLNAEIDELKLKCVDDYTY